jgi:hypothetical protein
MSNKAEDNGKESNEPDYDEDKDQLEERQEKETGELEGEEEDQLEEKQEEETGELEEEEETTNQVF